MLSVLFVDNDAVSSGDGLAWNTAFADVQDALTQAARFNGDDISNNDISQIWIAEGTYKPSAELEPGDTRSASFCLVDGVTIYGGFTGTESVLAERDPSAHETILSGDIGVLDDDTDNVYTVVYCGSGVTSALDGTQVIGGAANGGSTEDHRERSYGGGVFNSGSLTVSNCILSENSAFGGAAISNSDSSRLVVTNSTFLDNSAFNGGAIGNDHWGRLYVANSRFMQNSAFDGGAINCGVSSTLDCINSVFADNSVTNRGGAIFGLSYATVNVFNTTISGNAAGHGAGGVHIVYDSSTLRLRNSIVSLNAGSDVIGVVDRDSSNNMIGIDPQFVRNPGTNGNGDFGDLHLTAKSVAIDGGDSSILPADEHDLDSDGDANEPCPIDFQCVPRISGVSVDVGAYEFQSPPSESRETPSTVVTSAEDVFDVYDSQVSLREAIYYSHLPSLGRSVTFASHLSGATLLLNGTSLVLDTDLSIDASSLPDGFTIDAGGESRVFIVIAGADDSVELTSLVMTGGLGDRGGGIHNSSSSLSITRSVLRGNVAESYGGAIYTTGSLTMVDSSIEQNTGSSGGGICNFGSFRNDGIVTLTNTMLSGNTADYQGGGIYSSDGTLTIDNSIISGNFAAYYGGGISSSSDLTIRSSTLSGNISNKSGGGLCIGDASDTAKVTNTIIALNDAPKSPNIHNESSTLTGSHNLIGDDSGQVIFLNGGDGNLVGTAGQPLDPLFIRVPGTNGDNDYGDLHLQPISPAIGVGDNLSLSDDEFDLDGDGDSAEPIPVDLGGDSRTNHQTVDIGAYECTYNAPPILNSIANQVINEESPLSFTICATDPDEDPITLSASGLPAGATFNTNTGTFSWTPTEVQDGVYTVTFTATDDGSPNLSDSETITISVGEVNACPVLAFIGNKTVNEETTPQLHRNCLRPPTTTPLTPSPSPPPASLSGLPLTLRRASSPGRQTRPSKGHTLSPSQQRTTDRPISPIVRRSRSL